ncbi:MAG TPA: hypothetical protein VFB58_05470 [Chloroflexota bacterium]|nr:hypothetical protein [Chloroflexota bacterium]
MANPYQRVPDLLARLLGSGRAGSFHLDYSTNASLEKVLNSSVWGYREILLVMVVGRLLDPTYSACTNFYACHPRSLFENHIRPILRENGIPHRKSGPLNIAKGAEGINEQWAARRRDPEVAPLVVSLTKAIDQMTQSELEHFGAALMRGLADLASHIAGLTGEEVPESEPEVLYRLCKDLIVEVPDGGNTPQRIVGLLMYTYHASLGDGVVVSGHEDRASVTSTTSHKPGDIQEEKPDGEVLSVYEVTVKPFTDARITESFDTLKLSERRTGYVTQEVFVLCRPDDVPESAAKTGDAAQYLGRTQYEDTVYHFVDIFEWTMGQLLRMTPAARLQFHTALHEYISDPNTSEQVKRCWTQLKADLDLPLP